VLRSEDDLHVRTEGLEDPARVNEPAIDGGRVSEQPHARRAELGSELRVRRETVESGSHAGPGRLEQT
jgi:hypothetical protein